jgi:DNA mismatch repair protein MutS2
MVNMGIELDLHRLTVDEAIPRIDNFLNDTYCAGLHYVRIVHGKGSGVLRQEVSRYLSTHPLVKSFHSADRFNGSIGATEVVLIDK